MSSNTVIASTTINWRVRGHTPALKKIGDTKGQGILTAITGKIDTRSWPHHRPTMKKKMWEKR